MGHLATERPYSFVKLVCSIKVIKKYNSRIRNRFGIYLFIRYIANIKAGTQIIKVAASGETPNISANKSLTACIIK